MTSASRRRIAFLAAILIIIALCIVSPRVMAFTELAARELRFLWWLVLIAAIGFYFAFFFGRKKDD